MDMVSQAARDWLTDNRQRSGDQGADESGLSLAGLEVIEQLGHDDAEHVADSADDEVGQERGADDRPAPAAVRRQRDPRLPLHGHLLNSRPIVVVQLYRDVDIRIVDAALAAACRHSGCRHFVNSSSQQSSYTDAVDPSVEYNM